MNCSLNSPNQFFTFHVLHHSSWSFQLLIDSQHSNTLTPNTPRQEKGALSLHLMQLRLLQEPELKYIVQIYLDFSSLGSLAGKQYVFQKCSKKVNHVTNF
jgi:hypothetical protein